MASLSETLALYILQPFHQLLQDNQEFKWSPRCEEAFKKAKDSLSSSNVLVHYDPSLPVILESDASQYGIGAVIFHRFPNGDERPNAYATRSLNLSEKKLQSDWEGRFCHYFWGHQILLVSLRTQVHGCELIINPCWKYLLRILQLQFWLLLDCNTLRKKVLKIGYKMCPKSV